MVYFKLQLIIWKTIHAQNFNYFMNQIQIQPTMTDNFPAEFNNWETRKPKVPTYKFILLLHIACVKPEVSHKV